MSSLVGSGIGIGQQDASNSGIDFGGMSSWLDKLDPIGNKITQIGGDPLNLYGNKNNPNALLFPGGQNPNANAVPSVLPNLGAASLIPQTPQGGFMPLGQTNPLGGNGGGIFNMMAANSAGQLFSPGYQNPKGAQSQPQPQIGNSLNPQAFSLANMNIGNGGYGRTMPYYGNTQAK